MSVWASTWAYEQTVKPASRKFTLVALANFANEDGYCFPSQETLASMTDQGVSTVREHLKTLEADKFISREPRYKKGGGRTSDGFWLQAPIERLKPPAKRELSKAPKSGGMHETITPTSSNHTARTQQSIPPNLSSDPSGEPLEGKKGTAHTRLFKIHHERLSGKVMDGAAQGKAVKKLLANYTEAECRECYESQLNEGWRKRNVSWLTVEKGIGSWLDNKAHPIPVKAAKSYEWQGQFYALGEMISDDGERFTVMGADGTPSKRWHTPEAFALDTGRDVEKVRVGWN